jgi:hypothetical protein
LNWFLGTNSLRLKNAYKSMQFPSENISAGWTPSMKSVKPQNFTLNSKEIQTYLRLDDQLLPGSAICWFDSPIPWCRNPTKNKNMHYDRLLLPRQMKWFVDQGFH